MKRFAILCALAAVLALPLAAQEAAKLDADASYALGMLMGANLQESGFEIGLDEFIAGVKATLSGGQTRLSQEAAQAALRNAVLAAQAQKAADNLAAGKAFLADNAKKSGVKATASGLQYEVLAAGTGAKPAAADTVTVNYEGRLLDGTVFDSSYARGESATFPLDGVIKGWTEGLQLMPSGSKYRFYIPSELAYGEAGAGEDIAPNSVLVFEVELLSVEKAAK